MLLKSGFLNSWFYFFLFVTSVSLLFSCKKNIDQETEEPVVIIQFTSGTKVLVNTQVISTPQTIDIPIIKRTASNSSGLSKRITISIKNDTSAVHLYNSVNGTELTVLPSDQYSAESSNPLNNGFYSVLLNSGEAQKSLKIIMNNTLAPSPHKRYALGFTISETEPGVKISDTARTIIVEFYLRNGFDGVYELKSYFDHPSVGGHTYVSNIDLVTTGTNEIAMYSRLLNVYAHPIFTPGLLYIVDMGPVFKINPLTNQVTSVSNYYINDPRPMYLVNTYNNRYDPVSKTIYVKYGYFSVSNKEYTDTLIYKSER